MAGRSRVGATVSIAVAAVAIVVAVAIAVRSGPDDDEGDARKPGADDDRGGSPQSPPPTASANGAAHTGSPSFVRMRAGEPDAAAAAELPPGQAFEAEPVDPERAPRQSNLVRERMAALTAGRTTVDVPVVECHTRWCRVVVAGRDETEFRAVVESMQDERGFLGLAESLALDQLRRDPEGRMEVDILLRF